MTFWNEMEEVMRSVAVGVVFKTKILKETDDTLACRLGVWLKQSVFSGCLGVKTVC